MRKIITSLIAILVVTNLEAQQRTPKLVVCITVDQLRGDYIEYFYNTFGERGFKRLMNEGLVYNNIRFEFSDIDEASAFATLFTGSNPNFIPQHLNTAFIPLVMSLWLRSGYGVYRKIWNIGYEKY